MGVLAGGWGAELERGRRIQGPPLGGAGGVAFVKGTSLVRGGLGG